MAVTYDPSTPIGMVRLTIGDTPDASGAAYFQDSDIQAFLTAQNGNVGFASVQALRSWARALASKPKVQIGDYTRDPAAQSKALMSTADALAVEIGDEADDPFISELGGEAWVRY